MNKQQIKGSVKETAGKIQKSVGKSTGNGTQAIKGKAREMAGKAEKTYGNAKDDARRKSDRELDRQNTR